MGSCWKNMLLCIRKEMSTNPVDENTDTESDDTTDSFHMFSTYSHDSSISSLSDYTFSSCDSTTSGDFTSSSDSSTFNSDFNSSEDVSYELITSDSSSSSNSDSSSSSESISDTNEEFFVTPNAEEYENILPINNNLAIKCSCCHFYFSIEEIQSDGSNGELQNICINCLKNNTIVRCCKCNNFVIEMLFGWRFHDRNVIEELCGKSYYCERCFPPIIFKYTVNIPEYTMIHIAVPKNKENGIEEKYFYDHISEKIGVSFDKILISGKKYNGNIYFPYRMNKEDMYFVVDIDK